jgi:gluconolactonase
LLTKDIAAPNGVAFSPDEKTFYVNDAPKKIIMRFDVQPDDTIANGRLFIDMSPESSKGPGSPDGMKVDEKGNVYSSGPGGVWIISPSGKHMGTITFPERAVNFAFGDADGKTLYVTALTGLYRIRTNIAGVRP